MRQDTSQEPCSRSEPPSTSPSEESLEDAPLTLLSMPEDALREILSHLGLRDSMRASTVCKTFHSLLVTSADPESWDLFSVELGAKNSGVTFHWRDWKVSLDPHDLVTALKVLQALFSGSRARRFSEVIIKLYSDALYELHTSALPSAVHFRLLNSALSILKAAGFKGEVAIDYLPFGDPKQIQDFLLIMDRYTLPFRINYISLIDSESDPITTVKQIKGLARLQPELTFIEDLQLPLVPSLDYRAVLSDLPQINVLALGCNFKLDSEFEERWDVPGMTMDKIGGLRNILGLVFLPRIGPGSSTCSALSTLVNLRRVELSYISQEGFPWVGEALASLTALSSILLCAWDEDRGSAAMSPLSSLPPLCLPDSARELTLWFRLPEPRTKLRLNLFHRLEMLRDLSIHLRRARGAPPPPPLQNLAALGLASGPPFKLQLGTSLGALTALTGLELCSHGLGKRRMSVKVPATPSVQQCLTSLCHVATCGVKAHGSVNLYSLVRGAEWREKVGVKGGQEMLVFEKTSTEAAPAAASGPSGSSLAEPEPGVMKRAPAAPAPAGPPGAEGPGLPGPWATAIPAAESDSEPRLDVVVSEAVAAPRPEPPAGTGPTGQTELSGALAALAGLSLGGEEESGQSGRG